ncbi:hypothetical protein BD410DRAFT_846821 [Rickenella mellea]|uniref:Uncharacterized protein n=1 Tax=Rickenella mellea TaxID=50990 RepID=A0A4Y7PE57_9AGAM|nr:hypothetical protein BD410DRAFT_846821 [Rickenella mellea]
MTTSEPRGSTRVVYPPSWPSSSQVCFVKKEEVDDEEIDRKPRLTAAQKGKGKPVSLPIPPLSPVESKPVLRERGRAFMKREESDDETMTPLPKEEPAAGPVPETKVEEEEVKEQEQEQEEQEQDELIKINPEEDPEGYMEALETKYAKMGAHLTVPNNCVIIKFELQDEFLYGTYSYLPALTLEPLVDYSPCDVESIKFDLHALAKCWF